MFEHFGQPTIAIYGSPCSECPEHLIVISSRHTSFITWNTPRRLICWKQCSEAEWTQCPPHSKSLRSLGDRLTLASASVNKDREAHAGSLGCRTRRPQTALLPLCRALFCWPCEHNTKMQMGRWALSFQWSKLSVRDLYQMHVHTRYYTVSSRCKPFLPPELQQPIWV